LIQFTNVTKHFKKNWAVLENITFSIDRGEFVFVTGKSGAGKSTLLNHMYMKLLPTSGEVVVDSFSSCLARKKEIALLRRKVGMIFQEFLLLNDRNVYENIALPLRLAGLSEDEIRKRTLKILSYTSLSHKMQEQVTYLSSGEKQRICIARALVNDPLLILADEPTGNLDKENSDEIISLLQNIHGQGTAIVMATHNTDLVASRPFRRIHLENGRMPDTVAEH